VPIRPPDWDWDWPSDGALALAPRLNGEEPFATVPAMSVPAPRRHERAVVHRARTTHRRRQLERERRLRRLAVLAAVSLVALVIVLLSAFGGSGRALQAPVPASATRLLPAGPPAPRIVARLGSLHLQLPISQSRVTAIGYAGGTDGAMSLDPLGNQANEGLVKRLVHGLVGGSTAGPRWYQLPGGDSGTSALDVGAPAGTDVYSPVDGTVSSIDRVVLNGRRYGSEIDLEPSGAPSLGHSQSQSGGRMGTTRPSVRLASGV
jgi:murein DD-endopeptidase MepM/ murein hydrolase activator NlpD